MGPDQSGENSRTEPCLRPARALGGASALLLALHLVAGCAARRGDVDLLEARLREQGDRLAELETQLDSTTADLQAARREADQLRTQLASGGGPAMLPEQAGVLSRAVGIRFNSLLTGGFDEDGTPGDDLLTAMLAPHDADGELLKLPGRLELELLDLTRSGTDRRIGAWSYSVEESRSLWHRGFVGSGYLLKLPWQEVPTSDELLLHARLTTVDDRQFDTSLTIEVDPPRSGGDPAPEELFSADEPQPSRGDSSADGGAPGHTTLRRVSGRPVRSPAKLSRDAEPFAPEGEQPRGVIRTSDSWTTGTIPRYR